MKTCFCYVGCYSGAPEPEALHVLACDPETGAVEDIQTVRGVEGTSYLAIDREGRYLYSILGDERKRELRGKAVRFALEGGRVGRMEVLAELPCPAPCHVELSPDGRTFSFAAYRAGTAGTLPTDAGTTAGVPSLRVYTFPDDAMGPNKKRQEKAFAHQTFYVPQLPIANFQPSTSNFQPPTLNPQPSTINFQPPTLNPQPSTINFQPPTLNPQPSTINQHPFLLGVVDLGCDRIWFFDPATMKRNEAEEITFDPGDGPRHAIWSKDGRFLFVLCELASCVYSFAYDGQAFRRTQRISMLPDGFNRWNPDGETLATKAAAIKLTADGKTLLASNRGHDSIAIYSVNTETGTLTLRNIAKLSGRSPRDFELMPGDRFVVVGYELDDALQVYRFDSVDATLTPAGASLKAWHPVCFKFARRES